MTTECVREYRDLPYCHLINDPLTAGSDCKKEFGDLWKWASANKMNCNTPLESRVTCVREYEPKYDKHKLDCCAYPERLKREETIQVGPNYYMTQTVDYLPHCHPNWKDPLSSCCHEEMEKEVNRVIANNEQPNDRVQLWMNHNKEKVEKIKTNVCPSNGGLIPNTHCYEWCERDENMGKCMATRINHCTQGTNIYKDECQHFKRRYSNKGPFIEAEFNYCNTNPDARMRTDFCFRSAMQPDILEKANHVKGKYDEWWRKFCDKVHTNPSAYASDPLASTQCACSIPPWINPQEKPSDIMANPTCYNVKCITDERAYRNAPAMDKTNNKCPNVCLSIIEQAASNLALINNVTIIQQCAGLSKNEINTRIAEAITKSLKENIKYAIRVATLTGQKLDPDFIKYVDDDNKPYERARNKLISVKESLTSDNTRLNSIEIILTSFRPMYVKAVELYHSIRNIDWAKGTQKVDENIAIATNVQSTEELTRQYNELKNEFTQIFGANFDAQLNSVLNMIDKLYEEWIENTNNVASLKNRLTSSIQQFREFATKIIERYQYAITIDSSLSSYAQTISETQRLLATNFTFSEQKIKDEIKEFDDRSSSLRTRLIELDSDITEVLGGIDESADSMSQRVEDLMSEINRNLSRVQSLKVQGKLSQVDLQTYESLPLPSLRVAYDTFKRYHNVWEIKKENYTELRNAYTSFMTAATSLNEKLTGIKEKSFTGAPGIEDEEERSSGSSIITWILIAIIAIVIIIFGIVGLYFAFRGKKRNKIEYLQK